MMFDLYDLEKESPEWLELPVGTDMTATAIVETEIYYNEEQCFGVYSCRDEEGKFFKAAGEFPYALRIGQTYELRGKVSERNGEKQLKVEAAYPERPSTKEGVIAFLKTLHGLKSRADLLYDTYGKDVVDILLNEPDRIVDEVKGIGRKSVASWKDQLIILQDDYHSLMKLMTMGLNMKEAKFLHSRFGGSAAEMVEQNPYWLQTQLRGFSFARCEALAEKLDFDPLAPERIEGGILYTLERATYDGHCYLPEKRLVTATQEMLKLIFRDDLIKSLLSEQKGKQDIELIYRKRRYRIPRDVLERYRSGFPIVKVSEKLVGESVEQLLVTGKLIREAGNLYLRNLYEDESYAAIRLRQIAESRLPFDDESETLIDEYLQRNGLHPEAKQREAVSRFTRERAGVHVLNGSAGCGKTFTLGIVLDVLERRSRQAGERPNVLILAPTGRAAKVASNATGRPAMTIHRALKYKEGMGFEHKASNPLPVTCVVVDESSMIDISLAASLFDAIPEGCKLIFIGDSQQLPSVGPGNVLKDLIESGTVDAVTLDVVKRQGADSDIILNANRIIAGQMIEKGDRGDAFFIRRSDAKKMKEAVIDSLKRLKDNPYDWMDIQVLLPMKRGLAGTYYMNLAIQEIFNPYDGRSERIQNRTFDAGGGKHTLYFQIGDKVMHTKNNYSLSWFEKGEDGRLVRTERSGIMNGEVGQIEWIRKTPSAIGTSRVMCVKYEDGYILYEDEFRELDHAFAMTIHKSQGSQWPCVLLILMPEHYRMLENAIFYTGYTRAEKIIVAIGHPDAFKKASATFLSRRRNTGLRRLLREQFAS